MVHACGPRPRADLRILAAPPGTTPERGLIARPGPQIPARRRRRLRPLPLHAVPVMTTMTLIQAVTHTLDQAMGRDDNVVILGEDVGKNGGVFRATDGLFAKYGDARVLDTPLNESLIIGAAIGMATYGLRPVPEIQFQDFIFPGFDQLVS